MHDINGSVDSGGGHVINGNQNTILNVIDGLEVLLSDYKGQLRSINVLIDSFRPKTALELLCDLEIRLKESSVPQDKKIESKILFLKALCKRELSAYSKEEAAKDFIRAYSINKQDTGLNNRACIEYLNIDEYKKAEELADSILGDDQYNITAWFVKAVMSNDLSCFLKSVPKVVKTNYNFQHSIIYWILIKRKIKSFTELENYSLELQFKSEQYTKVTAENKQAWVIGLDLLISKVLSSPVFKNFSSGRIVTKKDSDLELLIRLLEQFVGTLEFTEIADSCNHPKFYLYFIKFLTARDEESSRLFATAYEHIEKTHWFYTQFFCQFLSSKAKFQELLDCLDEYENLKGELHFEFYLQKATSLYRLEKFDDIKTLGREYLKSIQTVDEYGLFTFMSILSLTDNGNYQIDFQTEFDAILDKNFVSAELKQLTKSTITLRFFPAYNKQEIYQSLNSIKDCGHLSINCRNLIAENFDFLGKSSEALEFMNSYVDKSMLSESLRLYLMILRKQLQSDADSPKGMGNELLALLEFWRTNCEFIDEELLCMEHFLCSLINDYSKLIEVDRLLFLNFPSNCKYLYFYLAALELTGNDHEIKEISKQLPEVFEDEDMGLNIAGVLLRSKKNIEKGSKILYNLALDKNNTKARMNYFGTALVIDFLFKNYQTAKNGNWVIYNVDGKKEKVQLIKLTGIQKDLAGKSVGETFTRTQQLTGKISNVEIVEIFNDYLNLFREIEEEAKNPLNDLGLYSIELPADLNDFPKYLMEQFGKAGSENKKTKDQLLSDYLNYAIGFSALASTVFNNNYLDAYIFLTKSKNSKFITVPNNLTAEIDLGNQMLSFVLDFSSILLFYDLEKELDFKFKHKFVIASNIRHQIESYINQERHSPDSNMSMQITLEGVENYIYPINNQAKRIEFFQSVLDWIESNCVIDLVEEKLDIILKANKLKELDYNNVLLKIFIDSLYLSTRADYRMISSELFVYKSEMQNNFLNPEKYLITNYPEKCNEDFYRFLLKSKYLGIDISFENLKREFMDYVGGRENYFLTALENLQYILSCDQKIISTCIEFIKFLNNSALPLSSKRKFINQILCASTEGMEKELKRNYLNLIHKRLNIGSVFLL